MKRIAFPFLLLLALLLAACGGGGVGPEAGQGPLDAAAELATKEAANPGVVGATIEAVATQSNLDVEGTAATAVAALPVSDTGCSAILPEENADKSTLQANWTDDGRIRITGAVDAAVGGSGILGFQVHSGGQPAYWALFVETPPTGAEVELSSVTVSDDNPISGPLVAQNPFDPAAQNCVFAIVANSPDQVATDPFTFVKYLPVGGTAPATLAPAP